MDFTFKLIKHNCLDKLIPKYLERIGDFKGGFITGRLLSCRFYEVAHGGGVIGFAAESGDALCGFYIDDQHYPLASNAFEAYLKAFKAKSAYIASFDSALVALAAGKWRDVSSIGHYFNCGQNKDLRFDGGELKCASENDFQQLLNTGYFPESVLSDLIKNHCIYMYFDGGCFKAFGTAVPVKYVPSRIQIGAYVAEGYRGEGLGSTMLSCMAKMAADYHLTPIAECGAKNEALFQALLRAGFYSCDKLLKVSFSEV